MTKEEHISFMVGSFKILLSNENEFNTKIFKKEVNIMKETKRKRISYNM